MTGTPPVIAVGDDRSLRVTIDTRAVAGVLARAPKVAHFWIHGFLFRALVDHRVTWLQRKGPKFGRRGAADSKAIQVYRVNEGPDQPREEDVVYRVTPRQQRTSSPAEAVAGLRAMAAEAFAGSTVLRVHELGEDVRATGSRLMAIPIKTRPKTPAKWRAANPGKRLELRPSKRAGTEGLLYEVTKRRGRGRPRKGQKLPRLRERLRLRFVLRKQVEMDPTLRFFQTWQELAGKRAALWRGAADRMQAQLQRGDPRDF